MDYPYFFSRCDRTWLTNAHNLTQSSAAVHASLGMATELDELRAAIILGDIPNIKEEVGDFFYYFYVWCKAHNTLSIMEVPLRACLASQDIRNLVPGKQEHYYPLKRLVHTSYVRWMHTVMQCQDIDKAWMFYNRDPEKSKNVGRAAMQTVFIAEWFFDMLFQYNVHLREIMTLNNDKLTIRYPDGEGFTDEKANNRNLMAERVALVKESESHPSSPLNDVPLGDFGITLPMEHVEVNFQGIPKPR